MLTTLRDASRATCGGKAAALGALARAGLPVPDGFVVPFAAHRAAGADRRVAAPLREALAHALGRLGDPPVAVRSSAANEDTVGASAAGQYESVLAVRGAAEVAEAVRGCWASAHSARVTHYRSRTGGAPAPDAPGDMAVAPEDMAVLVQRLVDADVSGVMFTPARPGDPTRVEASFGLGPAVVGGTVTPDTYQVTPDGGVRRTVGRKTTRLERDRTGSGVTSHPVPARRQTAPALDDTAAADLAALGGRVANLLGGPQDVEWALQDGRLWLLQARPVTAAPPPLPPPRAATAAPGTLTGTPGASGVATGDARVVRGPADFARVRAGDILVCRHTDPAWTPLFTVAAGVVTEVGGALSHAAIVAREFRVPAVLGVARATARIPDGARITLDGAEGTVSPH